MSSHRRMILAIAALAVAALAASAFRSRSAPPASSVGSPSRGATRDEALRADLYVIAASPIRDSVRTTGTLLANESVNVVSELSRRLVRVLVDEGTEVEKDTVLFKLDDADLLAELARLQARAALASSVEKRQRELLSRNAASQQAYDQAATELRVAQAEVAAVRVTLAKTEIRAPFRARVGLRRASEGAWITPETQLTTLQDTSRMKLDFTLPERYAGAVSMGQSFRFQIAGRAEDFTGQVVAVEPAIDRATRSLLVRGMTDNPSGVLVPGAFASVDVPIEQAKDGILIPAQAVVPTATGQGVYVARNGRAELQDVQVGLRTRDSVEILRGLALGDTVVTSNLLRIRPGVRIEAEPSETARPAPPPGSAAPAPATPGTAAGSK